MHERIKAPIRVVQTATSEHIRARFQLLEAKELYTPHLEFEVQRRLGIVHHFMGRHRKAIKELALAAGLASALEIDGAVVAELYFHLGDAYFWLESYDEMMAISLIGLSKVKEKSGPEIMLLYDNLRRAYECKKDAQNSEKYAQKNQGLIKATEYFPHIDRVYHGIAWTLGVMKENLDYSLNLLLDGLKLCEENYDDVGICRCYHSIGDILGKKRELKKAIFYYKRAIEIAERLGYEDMLIYSYAEMGEVLVMMEADFDVAERYLLAAAQKAKQVGNNAYVALANNNLAKIYKSSGNIAGRVEALAEFAKHGRALSPNASLQALHELGTIHVNKGDLKTAAEYFLKGISETSSSLVLSRFLDGLEECYDAMGKSGEFSEVCRGLRERKINRTNLSQWWLSPASPATKFSHLLFYDEFSEDELHHKWRWLDPQKDCFYQIEKETGGLEIAVPPNHRLRRLANFDAPRLIQEIKGDFAIETSIMGGQKAERHGGMLVWAGSRNYLSLEVTPDNNIHFSISKEENFDVIGRGRLISPSIYLRLERRGNLFSAFCRGDGKVPSLPPHQANKNWFAGGEVELVMPEPIDIGVYGSSSGDVITTSRFGYFKIFIQGGTNA